MTTDGRWSGMVARESFGPAFWLGLATHVAVGELWLRAHPVNAAQLRPRRT